MIISAYKGDSATKFLADGRDLLLAAFEFDTETMRVRYYASLAGPPGHPGRKIPVRGGGALTVTRFVRKVEMEGLLRYGERARSGPMTFERQ